MAIADDSGLVVDALDGEPGVYSARYAGVHGDDAANNAKLLVNLEGVADEDRTARFMSVVALIDTDGLVTYGEGACEGVIAHEGRGDHGFGYDLLFLPLDDVHDRLSFEYLVPLYLFYIQNLTTQWENSLTETVATLLGRTTGGITLDEEDLAFFRILH